jgi:hypothetical protein
MSILVEQLDMDFSRMKALSLEFKLYAASKKETLDTLHLNKLGQPEQLFFLLIEQHHCEKDMLPLYY